MKKPLPPELLMAMVCEKTVKIRAIEDEADRERIERDDLLLRASRAGATYEQLAAACDNLAIQTIARRIKLARERAGPELAARLPRRHRLTEADVARVWKLYDDGAPYAEIAEAVGVGVGSIANIIQGRTWAHVEADAQ